MGQAAALYHQVSGPVRAWTCLSLDPGTQPHGKVCCAPSVNSRARIALQHALGSSRPTQNLACVAIHSTPLPTRAPARLRPAASATCPDTRPPLRRWCKEYLGTRSGLGAAPLPTETRCATKPASAVLVHNLSRLQGQRRRAPRRPARQGRPRRTGGRLSKANSSKTGAGGLAALRRAARSIQPVEHVVHHHLQRALGGAVGQAPQRAQRLTQQARASAPRAPVRSVPRRGHAHMRSRNTRARAHHVRLLPRQAARGQHAAGGLHQRQRALQRALIRKLALDQTLQLRAVVRVRQRKHDRRGQVARRQVLALRAAAASAAPPRSNTSPRLRAARAGAAPAACRAAPRSA